VVICRVVVVGVDFIAGALLVAGFEDDGFTTVLRFETFAGGFGVLINTILQTCLPFTVVHRLTEVNPLGTAAGDSPPAPTKLRTKIAATRSALAALGETKRFEL
jgi:hypothetical protein